MTHLSDVSRSELLWWIENVEKKNGKPIGPKNPSFLLETDASLLGWSAYKKNTNISIGSRWSIQEADNHINYPELLAIFYALKFFCSELRSVHISIQPDSTCAVAYVCNMGGMTSPKMDVLARKIWQWCLKRDIFLSARICSCVDVAADFSSRNSQIPQSGC